MNNTNNTLPPIIPTNPSTINDNTSTNSNELPTPPSVPLSEPSTFPTTDNKPPPPATTNPHSHPQYMPPQYYNKYYSTYYSNPMYNYPLIPHYPVSPYPTYHPQTHTHPHPHTQPHVSYQYPTFNGITPRPKNNYQPPPHTLPGAGTGTGTGATIAPPPQITSMSNVPQSTPPNTQSQPQTPPSIKSKSPIQSTPKIKLNPPKINPTFRPFYECENDDLSDDNDNDINMDDINESEDSDYDPSNTNTNGGKKKRKKKKKLKKHKGKKRKKKHENTHGKILYLAMQKIYVTHSECNIATKALKWADFRAWLKYNLEPYDHQKMDKKTQRELFTIKMQKLLNFCTYNIINNNGDIQYYYCLWLQIPQKQKWIQLIINDGNWFTNCTSEQQMMGYTTKISERDYFFFRVIEGHTTPNNIILLIRCDKGGNCGELVWLQKGQNVSGTDALAIENALSSALDLRWVYLHDDSKIKYGGNTSRSQCNLYLKTIRSIAKGQSWYSQAFYRPFNCTNWPSQTNINGKTQTGVEPGTVFTQNATQYKNAVNLIRGFKIKKLRKLLIYNTDFNKKGEKKGDNICNNNNNNISDGIYPIMHPSDLKKFDEVLQSMNEYDPYYEKYGKPKRLLNNNNNKNNNINIKYFFHFSEDEISIDSGDDDDICNDNKQRSVTPTNINNNNNNIMNNNRRQTRSRSRKDGNDFKREKLFENNRICIVRRWHRRRIKIKLDANNNNMCEYIHNKQFIEYRRQCNSIGDLAGILYHEGNPEAWGKDKNYGLKLIRGAKENLIKFFQHILTSAETKEIKHLTPQFKEFHIALKSIENTKIFGKRSKRWALKMNKIQVNGGSNNNNNNNNNIAHHNSSGGSGGKSNPIQILSQSQSPMKMIKQRQKSTEPLMDIAIERQQQMNRLYYNRNYNQRIPPNHTQIYYNHRNIQQQIQQSQPHWAFRGYPSTVRQQHNIPHTHNGYFNGFNRELRNGLAVDAEKLKLKQLQERRKLNDHKTFLKKDLDSHLIPNKNNNNKNKKKKNDIDSNSNRRKLLFESLKGPSVNIGHKKTVQPPLRVHRNLVDSISPHKNNNNISNNNNNNKDDTDSTLSTINNDSDTTINTTNKNINVRDNECLKINGERGRDKDKKHNNNNNNNVIILDDIDNNKHTLSGHKRQINNNNNIKQPPNKRIKLNKIPITNVNHMNRDELILEIKKYDKLFLIADNNNNNEWCRYCGSEISSKWNVRNKMILCEIHDNEYKNNKQFKIKIDKYKKIPRNPIDKNKNSELKYLKKKLNFELSKLK